MKPLNQYIDHTLLKVTASKNEIKLLCEEAIKYNFYAVCVNGCYVPLAKKILNNSSVNICSVVGFPLGAMSSKAKAFEAKKAVDSGADEIDMVMNVGYLKSKNYEELEDDIMAVRDEINHKVLKVILETCYLEPSEIIEASRIALKCKVDFIKTSTGFGTRGASLNDIKLMKSVVDSTLVKIKASGGIRDTQTAMEYINLGVDRIGTSSGIAIIEGKKSNTNY